jgi:hypothetical protein
VSSEGFLLRFLLGLTGSLAVVSLAAGCAASGPHVEAHVLGAGVKSGFTLAREVRSLPVIAGEAEQSRLEPRFARIGSALAGKPLEVRCWSVSDWRDLMRKERSYTHGKLGYGTLGFAEIGGTRVSLGPAVCDGLVDLAYKRMRPTDEAGQLILAAAVVTLSHEPQHSKGIADEAVAECNAIQLANGTAIRLGASSAYAAALVRAYWRYYAEELPAYRSSECRKGGKLDLGHTDSIWP